MTRGAACVRTVVVGDRPWPGYGHGAFGETFGRGLAAWLWARFEPEAGFRVEEPAPRKVTIWTRRGE